MTHSQLVAILMALAPARPTDYRIGWEPTRAGQPRLQSQELLEVAITFCYKEGDFDTNLAEEADGLVRWFHQDGFGPEDMNAQPAIAGAVSRILEQNPDCDEALLRDIADKLIAALESFAVDYSAWLRTYQAEVKLWDEQADIAWRLEWATRIVRASA